MKQELMSILEAKDKETLEKQELNKNISEVSTNHLSEDLIEELGHKNCLHTFFQKCTNNFVFSAIYHNQSLGNEDRNPRTPTG